MGAIPSFNQVMVLLVWPSSWNWNEYQHQFVKKLKTVNKIMIRTRVTYDTFDIHKTLKEFLLEFQLALEIFDILRWGSGLPKAHLVILLQVVLQLLQSFDLKSVRLHSWWHPYRQRHKAKTSQSCSCNTTTPTNQPTEKTTTKCTEMSMIFIRSVSQSVIHSLTTSIRSSIMLQ